VDRNGDGKITKKEFRTAPCRWSVKAMAALKKATKKKKKFLQLSNASATVS